MPDSRIYSVQTHQDSNCTYEIRAFFGEAASLEEILAQHALQGVADKFSKRQETACMSGEKEV